MKQKSKEKQLSDLSNEKDTIVETIRKSQLVANNKFDFKKLCRKQEGFLDCIIEEEKESLTISYDIHDTIPWTAMRKESRELILSALIDAGKLCRIAEGYQFSLNPSNLYYDVQGRVFIKSRDVYNAEEEYSQENFIMEYRSLIGCTLVKKYRFEDYNDGGQDLLKEDKLLNDILNCTEVEQIIEKLHEEYIHYRQEHQERFVEISKVTNKSRKATIYILSMLVVVSIVLFGYLLIWERPYEKAVIAANEAYLQSDYNGTVEALDSIEVNRMNVQQKYILAIACVKCESFNEENMKNILNTITLNGDEKVMEYWIYINRLDTEKAVDIAMQESSNQLLYYAYLKEKAVIENDSSLTGQEKNERLSEIENKLKPLEDEYSTITEE